MKHWKISDFANKVGKHNNTVDGWFRELEIERGLHYISRVNGDKVYDELDLEIAQFIVERRNNKWSLGAIFDDLSNHFNLRPFPKEFENIDKATDIADINKVKVALRNEMENMFKEVSKKQMEEQKKALHNLLPSREQERLDRFNSIMAERKVSRILEEEALNLWNKKPLEERMIKVGWFRQAEDREKRDLFIKKYIDKHFEKYLKKEFDI